VILYNQTSERLLVCALLERPRLRRHVMRHMHENLFGFKPARDVYIRMVALQEQGKKVPTVGVMSQDPGLSSAAQTLLKIGPRDRVRLQNFRETDIDHCLDQVRYYYRVRVLYEMNKWVAEQFETPAMADIPEVQAEIQQRLLTLDVFDEVSQNTAHVGHGANITDAEFREALSEKTIKTIPTGYQVIDDRAKWGKGNMVLLTAKRGQGKSLFAKSLGLSHFRQGQNVLTVNLEMEKWEYLTRLFAETTPFTHDELRGGLKDKDLEIALGHKKRLDAAGMLRKPPNRWSLRTIRQPDYTPAQLHNELRHQGYHVVIIDYLNLFKQVHKDLWQSLYAHTKYLKMMAKDLGILLYVLAQLTDDGRAKYARAAEEDSDAWLFWEINRGNPECKFFHGKARHYKPYSFPLVFDYFSMAFVEEHALGWVCKNSKCRATYELDLKGRINDLRNPVLKEDKKTAARLGKSGLRLLSEGRCPECKVAIRDPETRKILRDENGLLQFKTHKLVDHLKLLKRIAEKDAEEHQKHVEETEADRKNSGDSGRRRRHNEALDAQAQRDRDDEDKK
jgi:replicative DNA helicase